MKLESLLDELIKKNINIKVQEQELRVTGSKENITPDIIGRIKENKQSLLAYLNSAGQENDRQVIIPLAAKRDSFPLSSSQYRIWVLSQWEEASIAYNMPGVDVFEGTLDRAALTAAFDRLIQRHESLRTVFREDEAGEVRQVILPAEVSGFGIGYTDLRTSCADQDLTAIIGGESVRPFDLSAGPLLRAWLYQVEEQKWVFTYTMYHIISDGWSMGVLFRELLELYRCFGQGEADGLPMLR